MPTIYPNEIKARSRIRPWAHCTSREFLARDRLGRIAATGYNPVAQKPVFWYIVGCIIPLLRRGGWGFGHSAVVRGCCRGGRGGDKSAEANIFPPSVPCVSTLFSSSDTKGAECTTSPTLAWVALAIYQRQGRRTRGGFPCRATPRVWTRGATDALEAPSFLWFSPSIEHLCFPERRIATASMPGTGAGAAKTSTARSNGALCRYGLCDGGRLLRE